MIDFSTLQGLTIPEGAVTKISKDGVTLWAFKDSGEGSSIILNVEKMTANTYDGTTVYSSEKFIRLVVSVKDGGTAYVSYGGLTKEMTEYGYVTFGTYFGQSDDVETPDNGELVISGDYDHIVTGPYSYKNGSKQSTGYYNGITEIVKWGRFTSIPPSAFRNTNLSKLTIPKQITKISNLAFFSCKNLTEVEFLNDDLILTEDDSAIFEACTSLEKVTLPKNLTLIPKYTFNNSTLKDIDIPNKVTVIGEYAFSGVLNLTVVIPASVTTIGDEAFSATVEATMLSTTPPTISANTFSVNYLTKIIVPNGCGNTYKGATNWSAFADLIEEAS